MMKNKFLLILEIVWIIVGFASIAAGVRYAVSPGGLKTIIFFVMAIVAFLFAWVRHTQRKKN